MDCSTPGFPVHHQLPNLAQTHVHRVSDAIHPSHPLSSPSPSFNLSQQQGLFKWVSSSHQVAKVSELQLQFVRWVQLCGSLNILWYCLYLGLEWKLTFSSPVATVKFSKFAGILSTGLSQSFQWIFRTDFFAVQGTPKNLLQHHSSEASILQCSAFFVVQLAHPYLTTAKTIALTRWTFVNKVISLFFNMLSALVIAFLPRSKHLLISWLQLPSPVILEPKKTVSIVCPSVCHEVMGPDAMIFGFWILRFKQAFSLSSFTFINRLFSSSFFHKGGVICISEVIGSWQSWF